MFEDPDKNTIELHFAFRAVSSAVKGGVGVIRDILSKRTVNILVLSSSYRNEA